MQIFIFILIDDLGWTSSSQLMDGKITNSKSDYYETPQIEKLAAKGIRFSSGYAPCAVCCPTRRSIQFGQTPARQGDIQFPEKYKNHKINEMNTGIENGEHYKLLSYFSNLFGYLRAI